MSAQVGCLDGMGWNWIDGKPQLQPACPLDPNHTTTIANHSKTFLPGAHPSPRQQALAEQMFGDSLEPFALPHAACEEGLDISSQRDFSLANCSVGSFEEQTDYRVSGYEFINATDASECCGHCAVDTKCRSWSFLPHNEKHPTRPPCHLKPRAPAGKADRVGEKCGPSS